MSCKQESYKRLGDYIREVNNRNSDLSITKLMGINIEKYFMPSVANVIGTDLSNYKIVSKNQFACNLMHVGRDAKIPVALNQREDIIVSPAYFVFEVCNSKLLPEYLQLVLKRPEFDRNAWFHTDGDVRGGMDKDGLRDLFVPIPNPAEQQRIVDQYNAIQYRIENNKKTIAKLEETAQAIYRKMFVDDIDPENLPDGWRMGTLGEVAEITMGQSPDGSTYNENGKGLIFYQGRTDFGYRFPSIRMFTTSPTRMAKLGDILLSVRAPVGDLNIAPHNCCIGRGLAALHSKIECNSFVYYLLQTKEHDFNVSNEDGTIFGSITKDHLFGLPVIIPNENIIIDFEAKAKVIDNEITVLDKEIDKLTEMLSLMMAEY